MTAVYEQGGRSPPDTESAWALILDLQPPEWRDIRVGHLSPPVWSLPQQLKWMKTRNTQLGCAQPRPSRYLRQVLSKDVCGQNPRFPFWSSASPRRSPVTTDFKLEKYKYGPEGNVEDRQGACVSGF